MSRITGDVTGRPCLIVDDMIATGSTITESVRALRHAGALPEITVAATHAVFADGAVEKIAAAGVRHLVVTDTIPAATAPGVNLRPTIVSVAPLLASAVRRLFDDESLRELS